MQYGNAPGTQTFCFGYTGAMLEMKPNCENCLQALPPDATNALICSYECTFCHDCAAGKFELVCPNCGGELVPRPVRRVKG